LYRDEVDAIEIQAYDQQGNLFTTLEGLEFQWSIFPASMQPSDMTSSKSRGTSVLTLQAFKESTIEVPNSVLDLEAQGKTSWLVLVRGIDTGKANIASRLVAIGYDVCPTVRVPDIIDNSLVFLLLLACEYSRTAV
jgi:nuclear pore complex protein Nup210